VKSQLGPKTHWDESNDLDMMFAGTYRSEFYRNVRDLLHAAVAAHPSPALLQRWNDLVSREAHFRTRPERALESLAAGGAR